MSFSFKIEKPNCKQAKEMFKSVYLHEMMYFSNRYAFGDDKEFDIDGFVKQIQGALDIMIEACKDEG